MLQTGGLEGVVGFRSKSLSESMLASSAYIYNDQRALRAQFFDKIKVHYRKISIKIDKNVDFFDRKLTFSKGKLKDFGAKNRVFGRFR